MQLYVGIHYMGKSSGTPDHNTNRKMTWHSTYIDINMELAPLCSYNSFHSYGKAFHRIIKRVSVGILARSSSRALVRSGNDVERESLACNLCVSSSQRRLMGLSSELCAAQSSSSMPNSSNHILWTLFFALGLSHAGREKGFPQSVPTKLES